MVRLLFFGPVAEAAGTREIETEAGSVAALLAGARARFGPEFAARAARARIWVNGELIEGDATVVDGDEVAVLPPVSGG